MTNFTNNNLKSQTDLFTGISNVSETINICSLFEEISDKQAEVSTGGARWNLRGSAPAFGSNSLGNYVTTSEFNDISVRLWNHGKDITISAEGKSSTGVPFKWEKLIPAHHRGVFTIASNVKDGTRFNLRASTPGNFPEFHFSGRMTA